MRFAPLIALAALSLCACGPSKAQVADLTQSKAAAAAYMAKAANDPAYKALPSGVLYQDKRSGPATGEHPKVSDEIKIHYEGKLAATGKVFDTTYEEGSPRTFPLAMLIPAWKEALVRMRPGDEWTLIVPPEQGYGEQDMGGGEIPPNSVLIFRIELIGILPHPQIGQG
jgi:peptidylprolyl isomerase/FKBP-type peptidyl-prolyl cis-trans isomerase FklB